MLLTDKKIFFLGKFKGKDVFYSEQISDFVTFKPKSHQINSYLLPLTGSISTLLTLILKTVYVPFRSTVSMNIIFLLLTMLVTSFIFLVVTIYNKKMIDVERVCFTKDEFVEFYKSTTIKLFFLFLIKFMLIIFLLLIVLLYINQGDIYTFLLINFLLYILLIFNRRIPIRKNYFIIRKKRIQ